MKFNKEDLLELEYDDRFEVIETVITGQRRWATNYKTIFKFDGKYYKTTYSKGSTENCDERPYEFEGNEIECEEVFPIEVKIVKYVNKKDLDKHIAKSKTEIVDRGGSEMQ